MTLYFNGRFLTQPMSGVQRFAYEIVTAFDAHLAESPRLHAQFGEVEILVPNTVPDPGWNTIRTRVVSGAHGHVWEQGVLYRASRNGVLVSLGNSGPLRHSAHVLCLHDANIYDIPEAFGRAYRTVHRILRPALARRAAALLTVSHYSARNLAVRLGVPVENFRIVPNSAEHVLRWPGAPRVLTRHGLTRGQYFLCVGNQSPNKNLAALVRAHHLAGPNVPPLVVVGGAVPGIKHFEVGQGIRALDRVSDEDLRALYQGAAAFVFPSLHEGFGIPPLEAMELGVPVLCASSGAMPEVLGSAPLWFDPHDVSDMARVLSDFVGLDSSARARMCVAGRATAAHYRWRDSAGRLIDILSELGKRKAAAA